MCFKNLNLRIKHLFWAHLSLWNPTKCNIFFCLVDSSTVFYLYILLSSSLCWLFKKKKKANLNLFFTLPENYVFLLFWIWRFLGLLSLFLCRQKNIWLLDLRIFASFNVQTGLFFILITIWLVLLTDFERPLSLINRDQFKIEATWLTIMNELE